MIKPVTLAVHINNACNFQCLHCYLGNIESPARFGDQNQLLRLDIVEQMFESIDKVNSVKRLPIIGMESFLNRASVDRLHMLAQRASDRDIQVSCITNGSNLKKYLNVELANLLAFLDMSLEGGPNTYSQSRRSSFESFLHNIAFATHQGMKAINLLITVSSKNIMRIDDIMEGVRRIEQIAPLQKVWFSPFIPTRNGRDAVTMVPTKNIALALARNDFFLKRDPTQTHLVIDRYHREACRVHLGESPDDLWSDLDLDNHSELRNRIWDYGDPVSLQRVLTMRHTGQLVHPLESLHGESVLEKHFIGTEPLERALTRITKGNEKVIKHFYQR